jgi:CHASE2 domain-containing sensor protein
MQELYGAIKSDIKVKGLRYWLLATAFMVAGMVMSSCLDSHFLLLGPRYTAYQILQRTTPRGMQYAKRVVFVAVGDVEFWKGRLDRRIPVKRDYLASLVEAVDAADPEVLAVDYVLRSPVADGSLVETPAYAQETEKLIAAIEGTRNSAVVLPATLDEYHYDKRTRSYPLDSSIFGNHIFLNNRVRWGYLNLPLDLRRIPLSVRVQGGKLLASSFSQQIVAAMDPRSPAARRSQANLYGSFMPVAAFVTIPAGQVLSEPAGRWRESVKHRTVIIGNFAHDDAYSRGPYIDSFQTPAGEVPGAAVHANYVEALVSDRTYSASPELVSVAAEALLSLSVSVILARRIAAFKKAGYFVIFMGSAFMLTYFLLQNLAVFFDPVIPVLAVLAHSLLEKAFGPHYRAV